MNILKRHRLRMQQKALMQKRKIYENLQTEHSGDEYFFRYTQGKMDALDEQAEQIRHVLELGCCK